MKTKRLTNTQGVEFTYKTDGNYISVLQLNNKKRFNLPYSNNLDVLKSIESFLNSIPEIKSFSLVVNNTSKLQGYLISIDTTKNCFIDLKKYL